MRALAVGAVIAFHAGVPGLDGGYVGVDVFFVISGFLITGQLLRLAESDHVRRGLIDFYARRIRRLLPVAFAVLVFTAILVRFVLPPLEWADSASAGRASALYYINVFLAVRNISYLSGTAPSPYQQYWSLAVEEQFYLIWPAALLILALVLHRRRASMAVTMLLACGLSFGLSVYVTSKQQPLAFFLLPTRAWEFGLGALLVLGGSLVERIPSFSRDAIAWAGLAAVVASVVLFGSRTLFPGAAALVPTLGTAAVLAAGGGPAGYGPGRLLSLRPLVWIGTISYSLYLWHWPLLVVPATDRTTPLSAVARALLVALTVVLAIASYRFIESPLRGSSRLRSRMWRSYGLAVALTIAGVVAATGALRVPTLFVDQALPSWPVGATPGSAPAPTIVGRNLTPSLATASNDRPVMPQRCIADYLTITPTACVAGDPKASKTMVLLGDSHAQQWFPALDSVARQDGMRLVTLMKVSCPPMPVNPYNARLGRDYSECGQWRARAIAKLTALKPSIVVIGHYYGEILASAPPDKDAYWATAMSRLLAELPGSARRIVIGDGPTWGYPPPVCLSDHLNDPKACSQKLSSAVDLRHRDLELAAARRAGATTVDMADLLCPDGTCPTILWNVTVYRDVNHVTATLATHMTPVFQQAVAQAVRA